MRRTKRRSIAEKLNVTKTVCNHIIGKEHGQHHRVTAGLIFMVFGVFVAKIPAGHIIGHVFFETVGFLFHCIGAIPLVQIAEKISEFSEENEEDIDQDELEEEG